MKKNLFKDQIITKNYHQLSASEKKVADLTLTLGWDIFHISITKIADKTNTSTSTVNRTFNKLGYNGFKYYKQFLFAMKNNLKEDETQSNLIESIYQTVNGIDENDLEELVKKIIASKKIMTIGEGFNHFSAGNFTGKLTKIGIPILNYDDNWNAFFNDSDLFIYISATAKNKSLFRLVEIFKKRNPKATHVLITLSRQNKALLQSFDLIIKGFYIDGFECDSKELPTDSQILLDIVLNIIFKKVYTKNKDKNDQIIKDSKYNEMM